MAKSTVGTTDLLLALIDSFFRESNFTIKTFQVFNMLSRLFIQLILKILAVSFRELASCQNQVGSGQKHQISDVKGNKRVSVVTKCELLF